MNHPHTQSYTYKYSLAQTTIAALSALVVVCMCLYGLMVFTIVHRVAYRQHAQDVIAEKTYAVGELESQYITIKNSVTKDDAIALGYHPVVTRSYITNRSLGVAIRPIE